MYLLTWFLGFSLRLMFPHVASSLLLTENKRFLIIKLTSNEILLYFLTHFFYYNILRPKSLLSLSDE